MHEAQAKGYYLEEIVRELMRDSHFINVHTGNIEGRGADHQIDSYGSLMFSIPFVYPVRLISEVKWFKPTYVVELKRIRDFVGVLIDISQNYFVPRDINSQRATRRRERYTDCGAYFSATGFSLPAQDYAWAHGVYLISFSQDPLFTPILARARELIEANQGIWNHGHAKKDAVVRMAQSHFHSDDQMRQIMSQKKAYFGILDELYPVMIIIDGEFTFDPIGPDNLSEEDLPLGTNTAIKERRIEGEVDVNFQFDFNNTSFSFNLPWITSKKIIQAIESTYGGEAFAFIDIPLVLMLGEKRYRRIFRIQLALPENLKSSLR